jgi:hypothetical protein
VTDTQHSPARVQAAGILKAWGSNNLELLHRNLALAVQEAQLPVADTGEGERLEILGAIADTMRVLLACDQLQSAARYLPLLQHLAAPPCGVAPPSGAAAPCGVSEYAFRC